MGAVMGPPPKEYRLVHKTEYIHNVALVYACRIYVALTGNDWASALIAVTEIRQVKDTRNPNIYDMQIWFDFSNGKSIVVHIILEQLPSGPYDYALRACDVPLYGSQINHAALIIRGNGKRTFRESLCIRYNNSDKLDTTFFWD